MPEARNNNSEAWIRLLESQGCIADRYYDIKRIDSDAGDGAFSWVFTAKDKLQKKTRPVALKFLNPFVPEYRKQSFHREAEILEDLKGQKNILPIVEGEKRFNLEINEIPFPLSYYSSYLARFNVLHYIYNEDFNFLTNIKFFREMCKAVQRIHSKDICHRDLKPSNFLVFGKRYVCLSDFGTARYFGNKGVPIRESYSQPVGDKRYTAPELLCGLHFSDYHNYCADIYSLGLILFELFTKTPLGSVIHRTDELAELIMSFNFIPEKDRIDEFNKFIKSFAEGKNLFSVRLFNEDIPKAIAHEVDILYRAMACLDYRKREMNFQRIFLRISICEKVIRYFMKYEEWKKRKKKLEERNYVKC